MRGYTCIQTLLQMSHPQTCGSRSHTKVLMYISRSALSVVMIPQPSLDETFTLWNPFTVEVTHQLNLEGGNIFSPLSRLFSVSFPFDLDFNFHLCCHRLPFALSFVCSHHFGYVLQAEKSNCQNQHFSLHLQKNTDLIVTAPINKAKTGRLRRQTKPMTPLDKHRTNSDSRRRDAFASFIFTIHAFASYRSFPPESHCHSSSAVVNDLCSAFCCMMPQT